MGEKKYGEFMITTGSMRRMAIRGRFRNGELE